MDKYLILNRIKEAYKFKTDVALSRFLGIKPNTLSGWYSNHRIDFDLIFEKCESISFDWLLTGEGEMMRDFSQISEKCIVCLEKEKVIKIQDKLIAKLEQEIEKLNAEVSEIKKYSGIIPAKNAVVVSAG